ncbi:AraC family transcriptional regulator [Mycobacterium sp. CVI_P3]|uniref:AraC family transcriptional regulator n=1 Tax=Mycobacterium pinniadriaticum TaxID=2994102 RepID=A0ABT3SMM7_9MYCO|nr:AraC family transcriptional regulator [Mycobacterium pinniadriaticum]MCX2933641.1 AraC family transcriptional regulator [Mycobacterium pinniadriaticum]MCX2940072.1 AraC family transcriptional regulator [Mycobacterium pinniadriaticum]
MSVVRGTSMSNYPQLVARLGGDTAALLAHAGIDPAAVGSSDVFVPLSRVIAAIENAAEVLEAPDFGRRLAALQGIEILGPVGVAARTSATVADALDIFENFLTAYSPAMTVRVAALPNPQRSFFEFQFVDPALPATPQGCELSLGVILRVLRFLLGEQYAALSVHIPHDPLTPVEEYRKFFGCTPMFAQRAAGFTIRSADLKRPLKRDDLAHDAVVQYLTSIIAVDSRTTTSVRTLVRQLLPSGTVTLELVAEQVHLHPKALQRRLAAEGTTFAAVVDEIRRGLAERYLRDTRITLAHLARELGYAEQSVLTRSCHRWFGSGPAAYRKQLKLN